MIRYSFDYVSTIIEHRFPIDGIRGVKVKTLYVSLSKSLTSAATGLLYVNTWQELVIWWGRTKGGDLNLSDYVFNYYITLGDRRGERSCLKSFVFAVFFVKAEVGSCCSQSGDFDVTNVRTARIFSFSQLGCITLSIINKYNSSDFLYFCGADNARFNDLCLLLYRGIARWVIASA